MIHRDEVPDGRQLTGLPLSREVICLYTVQTGLAFIALMVTLYRMRVPYLIIMELILISNGFIAVYCTKLF
jgi:hypothetical protein